MTRRERLERKLERRREWSDKAEARADSAYKAARSIVGNIPMGQPVLVGHHSEKRHRRDLERADSNMQKMSENLNLAKHHDSKAAGLASQLETTIFSDDPDAPEQIQAKIDKLEATCDMMKRANKAHKAAKGAPGWASSLGLEDGGAEMEKRCVDLFRTCPYESQPFPSYSMSNRRAEQRRLRERLVVIQARAARAAKAEAAPGGVIVEGTDWVRVTFAEKPAREVLNSLKDSGFRWGNGSWVGERAKLPSGILPA